MSYTSHRVACAALAAFLFQLSLSANQASAQPTAEQQSALRNNCRSDFMSNCSGVTPGGAEALQCLQRNVARLSPGCQNAVNALAPRSAPPQQATTAPTPAPAAPAAPAPAQPAAAMPPVSAPAAAPAARASAPTPEQQAALRQLCGDDYMAKCSHVAPASHQALQCLQSKSAELSANCRGALALIGPGSAPAPAPARAARPAPAPAARPAAAPSSAATAASPARPTAQQQAAIRQSCQGDFMSKCSGVQPGGADALRCLQRNSAQLSPSCRSAVAAIGGGTAAAPAAAATAPSAMPTPEQQNAIKMTCRRDFMVNCRGVPQGGAEAFACLQRNASRLSPDCRTSLAAIAGGATAAATAPTAAAPPAAGPMRPVGPLRRAIRERMMKQ